SRHRSGCPLATSHADDRFIVNSALRNRKINVRGTRVSRQTIRNCLPQHCLRARRPARVPDHTTRHRRHRLAWAREHLRWTRNQWASVLFSDDSRFTLSRNNGHQRSWRCQGERYAAAIVSLCLCMSNTGLISSSWMTMPQLIEVASSGNGCWRLGYLEWSGLHFLQT
uniref:Transposase Tc1-like domain-containing protein n=1 Tax=Sinocyclocheilus anshuiensis TaxID=1608454 RepID=A0A671LN17_9TELE